MDRQTDRQLVVEKKHVCCTSVLDIEKTAVARFPISRLPFVSECTGIYSVSDVATPHTERTKQDVPVRFQFLHLQRQTHTEADMSVCVACTHTYRYIYIYIRRAHTYIHTHTYKYTCMRVCPRVHLFCLCRTVWVSVDASAVPRTHNACRNKEARTKSTHTHTERRDRQSGVQLDTSA